MINNTPHHHQAHIAMSVGTCGRAFVNTLYSSPPCTHVKWVNSSLHLCQKHCIKPGLITECCARYYRSFKALALLCENTRLSHFGSGYCLYSICVIAFESTLGDRKSIWALCHYLLWSVAWWKEGENKESG